MNYSDNVIRSATLENMADENGIVDVRALADLYAAISANTIVTGFVYVSENGRAMQRRQAGIAHHVQFLAWQKVVDEVKQRKPDCRLVMQLAHAGLQTTRRNAVAPSAGRSPYFKTKARELTLDEIRIIVGDFATAAAYAQKAGFDAVQIHAAHGYLVHQFLSPDTNRRRDKYADGALFLEEILNAIRARCGCAFPVWLKVSRADDNAPDSATRSLIETIRRVEKNIALVEVSVGTMARPLDIIRGACPVDDVLRVNPLYKRYAGALRPFFRKFAAPFITRQFAPFTRCYNLDAALEIRRHSGTPVSVVGGIRTHAEIDRILGAGIEFVSLCRPFICEPDFTRKLAHSPAAHSACTNCNLCAVHCDAATPVHCHMKG